MKTSEAIENGKKLHPLTAILGTLKTIKEWLIPLILFMATWLFKGDAGAGYWRIIASTVIIGVSVGVGVISWIRYRYEVSDGLLKVERGVFVTKRQFIPIERIQSIDLTEGVLHRLFGVTQVQVQTAGGQKPEAVLAAVTREEALRLKEQLRRPSPDDAGGQMAAVREGQSGAAPETLEQPEFAPSDVRANEYKISFGSLLIAGMSSGSMGIGLSVIFAVMSNVDELFPQLHVYRTIGGMLELAIIPLAVVTAAAIAWLLGVCISVVKYANFTITRVGDELVMSRGLLERKQVTLPIARIQAVRIVEDLLWRPFGFAAIHVASAGYGSEKGETPLLFPLLRRSEIEPFLERMAPRFAGQTSQQLTALPRQAWKKYVLPVAIFLLAATLIAAWFTPWGWTGLALGAAAAGYGYWRYRSAGWRRADDMLVLRFRRIALTTVVIPRNRIQWCRTGSDPLERRWGLATLSVSIASGWLGAHYELAGMSEAQCRETMEWYRPARK